MPRGNKDIAKIGEKTRFNGKTAVEAGKKSVKSHRIKKCVKEISKAALYGRPPLSKEQLKPIAEYFGCKTDDINAAQIAFFKQVAEAMKGDREALKLLITYAGEGPGEQQETADPVKIIIDV